MAAVAKAMVVAAAVTVAVSGSVAGSATATAAGSGLAAVARAMAAAAAVTAVAKTAEEEAHNRALQQAWLSGLRATTHAARRNRRVDKEPTRKRRETPPSSCTVMVIPIPRNFWVVVERQNRRYPATAEPSPHLRACPPCPHTFPSRDVY
mmetsp:Transcript_10828/g.28404  ORF Transcript_10828/g.28404 Transcript_10828/m.28404 type:complete len:150 (+) Transcript_10828:148-597(+)